MNRSGNRYLFVALMILQQLNSQWIEYPNYQVTIKRLGGKNENKIKKITKEKLYDRNFLYICLVMQI